VSSTPRDDRQDDPVTQLRVDDFVQLEGEVWRALVAGDAEADLRMLSDDFLGVYPSGFADRTDHAAQLAGGPTMAAFELSDARLLVLSESDVLLSYRAAFRRAASPDRAAWDVMYISSLWCRRDGRWINVFSQDTPAAGSSPA
jgi:hypothetical protein